MKIVCGSCGAKYSIADEKVQGKVFKIRCKKCSNVIVVKGDSQQAEDHQQEPAGDSSMSAAYGGTSGASEWYVVIDGDQVGPISPEELEAYYTSGRVTAESFAWRDGLSDWQPVSDLEEFAHLTQHDTAGADDATAVVESPFNEGGGEYNEDATSVMPADDFRAQFEEQDSAAGAAAQDDMGYGDQSGFDAGYDDGGYDAYGDQDGYDDEYGSDAGSGAYAADGGQGGYDGFGGADAGFDDGGSYGDGGNYDDGGSYDGGFDDGGGYDDGYDSGPSNDGMFASFDSGADGGDSGYDGFGGMDDASESHDDADGGVQSANDMIGQRNENSVLFSLSSLDSVGAVGGGDQPDSGGADAGGGGGGAVTEGSGLIDIQNLASAHKAMKGGGGGGGGAAGPIGGPAAGGDEDPFGAGTMSMPALMPMGSHKSNKGLIIGLTIGGILLLGGIGTAIALFVMKDDEPQEPQQKVVYVEKESDDKEEKDDEKSEADKEAAAAAAKAVEDGDGAKKDGDEEAKEEGEDGEKKEVAEKKDDDKGSRKSTKPAPRPEKKPERTAKKEDKGGDDIDDLVAGLGNKSGGGSSGGGSKPAPKEDVPKSLSRTDVKNTVKKYGTRVRNCYTSSNRNKLSGRVFVKYTVAPSGRVRSASVTTGKFKGTDVGKCVERVVRQMQFPKAQTSLTVTYPFSLN